MIFDELVLTNVGPFKGTQCIPLTPRSPERPVVLFGGLNGSGKTTVLEALLLALYGGHTPGSARRARTYDGYLRHLINHDADQNQGAGVELGFRAVHDGAWRSFRILRSWSSGPDRVRETVTVLRDGMPDNVLAEGWAEYVETLAPRGVANLFFFDGEQIEAFADLEVAGELVRTAIGGLLGLDLVDRLREDLSVLERRKRQEAATGEAETEFLRSQQGLLGRTKRAEEDARHVLDEADAAYLQAKRAADKADAQLTREGGQRFQASEELRVRLREATSRRSADHKVLIDALAGIGPLLLVGPLLKRVLAQGTAEQRQADNQNLAALLADRDTQLLDLLRGQRTAAKVQHAVAEFLAQDVEHRKAGDGVPEVMGTNPQLLALGERLAAGDLAEERAHLEACVENLATAQSALDDAERAVAAIPAHDAVAETLQVHQETTLVLAQAQTKLDMAKRELEEATGRRQRAELSVENELKEANKTLLESEEALRVVQHAARTRETLVRLRAAATERHVQRIQALVLDSLRSLMRKDNLISEVKIDPVTCAVELLAYNGQLVRPRSLSAGERQLLAVSLLAGLARASGRMLPVVIDTPLGRLDQDHRKRLIQRYLPHASHQVIVLSTDTEITPQVLGKLGGSISHMIKLEHDLALRSTVVAEGYFEPSPADPDDEDDDQDVEVER
jgi:DNA sulfur modification protein DndD